MGIRNGSSGSKTILNASCANGVATDVCKTGQFGLAQDNAQVFISWYVVCTTGVGGVGIQQRLQKNLDISGATINAGAVIAVLASSIILLTGSYVDTPGVVGVAQYSINLQVTGGAAALTIQDASIFAYVL